MSKGHCIAVIGQSSMGKSTSLRNLPNAAVANCESGKALPFRKPADFQEFVITDPEDVPKMFTWVDKPEQDKFDFVVIDGLNFLMNLYETVYVAPAADGRAAWGNYARFFMNMMQQDVAKCSKDVVFTGHTRTLYNEGTMAMETKMPIKGALANEGLESYFTNIFAAKRMSITDLEPYEDNNELLVITEDERLDGFKYVFQTRPTADTLTEKMRNPMGLFNRQETFIDNDVLKVFKRLDEFHG